MWREVLRADPTRVKIMIELTWQLALLESPTSEQLDEALALAQRAVEAAPTDPTTYGALGIAQHARGDTRAALSAFRRALPRTRVGRAEAARDHLGYAASALEAGQRERAAFHLRRTRGSIQGRIGQDPALLRLWRQVREALNG